ncbi:MAG: outer membrane beta-barrel protein [Alistipes sp.]|nr:outer membrane beta-barrel protein [Alistipes sp.]
MRKIFVALIFTLISAATYAQGRVELTVIDAATNQGVAGAVVDLTLADDDSYSRQAISGYAGKTSVSNVKNGTYKLSISFIGYETLVQEVTISANSRKLGSFTIKEESTKLETVRVEAQAIRASTKGDTVSYNASAFKVANDADVEGLLKKMPGITVNNGSVEAQGETIKKIFVDGKEFFGEDVSTALNSLPAQTVKSVEVFNKLSDNAEFSGMDDGEGYKAINIVTHENMRQGVFGKLYAGYGYQPETDDITSHHKYNIGGNVNYFNGSSRLSVIGMLNNINQQNFSFEDIVGVNGGQMGRGSGVGRYMVRPQNGVANVGSIGLNYSNAWGEKEKVKLQGSYFFNNTATENLSELIKWYEAPLADLGTLEERGYTDNSNNNHRLNLRFDWRISQTQSLMSRTSLSFQGFDRFSTTGGRQWGATEQDIINLVDSKNQGGSDGLRFNEFLQYRVLLGKPGRLLTVDGRVNYRSREGDYRSHSVEQTLPTYDDAGEITGYEPLLRHISTGSDSRDVSVGASMTYAEPLSKVSAITLRYAWNMDDQKSDKQTMNFGADSNYINGVLDEKLSSDYESNYQRHSVGPGFRYSKERNTFIFNVNYQYSALEGKFITPKAEPINRKFNDFTYFMMGNFNITKQHSIRLFVMSNTENPDVDQLQDILNIQNAQYVSRGNENLDPSYSHRINFHYNYTNLQKGRTFMWMFSFQSTSDYIASDIYTGANIPQDVLNELDTTPTQYSTYRNADGFLSLRTHISYGLPINPIKCNLNLMGGVNYNEAPSYINGEKNMASNIGYDLRAVLSSNISENIDFTFSWNGTYSQAKNSLAARQGKNEYFNHSANGSLKAVFWKGFTFTASATYVQNIGYTNDYNDQYTLCNAYIGKKLFKNQLGEVMIGVNDIFDQNTSFARTTGSGFTQNSWNSVIGRYFTVQFNYNLRIFGKKGSREITDYEGMAPMGGGRGRGGMHGGMGPRF